MAKNDMFRVSLIGGYNKADVQEYIKTLENEIESVKVLHQKEKTELMRQLESGGGNTVSDGQVEGFREELRQRSEELRAKEEELLRVQEELDRKERGLQEAQEELTRKAQGLQEAQEELTRKAQGLQGAQEESARNAELHQETPGDALQWKTNAGSSENASLLRENQHLQEELIQKEREFQGLQAELTRRKEKFQGIQEKLHQKEIELQGMQEQCEELTERLNVLEQDPEKGFLDQKIIVEIIEDARKNAELIQAEAEKEKAEILETARQEAEQLKAELTARVNSELEDKGIQLIAAKHKIAQYMKDVKFAQEGLHNVYSRMNYIVENMPTRLDNYWDGEHYRMLEDSLKEENREADKGVGDENSQKRDRAEEN